MSDAGARNRARRRAQDVGQSPFGGARVSNTSGVADELSIEGSMRSSGRGAVGWHRRAGWAQTGDILGQDDETKINDVVARTS